jgi:N utilization substance protein A
MKSDFLVAIAQLAAEKNLPKEVVFEAVEAALASAYKKDNLAQANVVVKIDPDLGETHVYVEKEIVEEVEDPKTQISLEEARKVRPDAKVGEVVRFEVTPEGAGRIAAQTAKQVVLQRLREAEREVVYEEFSGREGDIVSGTVQRLEGRNVIVDLGRAEALLPPPEQVRTEHYRPQQRLKVYVLEVHKAAKGPQIIVSRTHKNLLRRLFELEVPEIFKGIVEIKAIAREAGHRSKVAVWARQPGVDPVGACVGLRGVRIQNVVNELNGERIDVIQWDPDPLKFVANALSPAQVISVTPRGVENGTPTAEVVVPDRQLSLAIGKEGQNARLAAKLTGWRIDIKSQSAYEKEVAERGPESEAELREAAEAALAAAAAREGAPAAAAVRQAAEERPLTPEEEAIAPFVEEEERAPEPAVAEVAAAPGAPAGPARPPIRFAEEILRPEALEKPKKKGKKGARAEAEEAKARKKRPRRPIFEEDEEIDIEDIEEFI